MKENNFVSTFSILFVVLSAGVLVNGQSAQLYEKARSCSFIDETTGYSLIWHTNCTGYVNFVLNFRDFPAAQGNFWIGVSFNFLSQELVLIEVNNNGFIIIQPARIYGNQPPQKNLMSPFLESPRGAFFGAYLEATFSIHESLLTGCKEWMFYTSPSRVGTPYQGQPFSKMVCNVAETCSRNNCAQSISNQNAHQYGQYGGGPTSNYFRPEAVLTNALYVGQPQRTYYDNNNNYLSPNYYSGQMNSNGFVGAGTYPQAYHNAHQGGVYGTPTQYSQFGQYGQRQFGQAAQYTGNTPLYTSQYGGGYGGGQYKNAGQYGEVAPLYSSQNMAGQYGGEAGRYGSPTSLYYTGYGQQQQPNYDRVAEGPSQLASLPPSGMSLSQIFAQLDEVSHSIYSNNNSPYHSAKVKKNRRKRQTISNNNPDSVAVSSNNYPTQLQGTAYEGQDKHFVRSTPYFDSPYSAPYYPTKYNKLLYDQVSSSSYGYPGYGAQNTDNPDKWRFFDPTVNFTPMYYPYRTVTAPGQQQQSGLPQRMFSFDGGDMGKCDGEVDPYWCADYVQQFVHWQQKYQAQSPEGICTALRESLRDSKRQHCCNTLNKIQCSHL